MNIVLYSLAGHPSHGGDSVSMVVCSTRLKFAFWRMVKKEEDKSARAKHSVLERSPTKVFTPRLYANVTDRY